MIIFCAVMAGVCGAGALTLPDAQKKMFDANLDIAVANMEQVKNQAAVDEAKSFWYPTVDIVGSTNLFTDTNRIKQRIPFTSRDTIYAMGTRYNAQIGLDAAYPFTQALVAINNVRYRQLSIKVRDAQNAALRNMLSFKLGLTYLQWELSYRQVDVQKTQVDQLQRFLEQIQSQKESGVTSGGKVAEVQARLAMAQYDLSSAIFTVDSLKAEVANLIQISDTSILPAPAIAAGDTNFWGSVDTVSLDVNRPELKALDLTKEQLMALDKVTSGQKYPNLIITAGLRYANPGLTMGNNEFMGYGVVGAQLRWNIFDGMKVRSQRKQTQQQAVIVQKQRDNQIAALRKNFDILKAQRNRISMQSSAAQASVTAAKTAVTDLKNALDAGVVTSTEYLNAVAQEAKAALTVELSQFMKKSFVLQLRYAAGEELTF